MQGARDKGDIELLSYYDEEWDKYAAGASCCDRVFAYMNRHWVSIKRAEGEISLGHRVRRILKAIALRQVLL